MSAFSGDLSRDLKMFLKHESYKPNFCYDAIGWKVDLKDLKHHSIRPIKCNAKDFFRQYKAVSYTHLRAHETS